MIIQIPLRAIPNQQVKVILNNQQCTINVYARISPRSEEENIQTLLVNEPLYTTELGIDGFDPLDWLLINDPDPLSIPETTNLYMDLYVGGVLIYQGMIMLFGSSINQYKSPLFNGYLYVSSTNDTDPEYLGWGTIYTLNWTDGNG